MTDETKPGIPLTARLKNLFIGGLIGLALGGGWAGYVWWTGGVALTEAQDAHAADLAAAKVAAEALNTELDSERRKVALLGARADVSRAMENLEQQNYGVVSNMLKRAAQRLEGVDGATAIADNLRSHTIDAAMPEASKELILGMAGELDAVIGR
jgi:hypothetical protein